MSASKPEVITFKADRTLRDALAAIENRSEFIRSAILSALENLCPLCRGRGLLTPNQREHWRAFAADHGVAECGDCHEWHLVCGSGGPAPEHVHSQPRNEDAR